MSDEATWPNGVPIIRESVRRINLEDPSVLRELVAALWLYTGRYCETKLTTEQKELFADVVEAESEPSDPPFVYDRWWQRDG
jgi:hypothetical protein